MRKRLIPGIAFFNFVLLFSITFFSCSSTKKTKYFQDIPDSGSLKIIPKAEFLQPTIQSDDILTILVETVDPAATLTINLGNIPVQSMATAVGASSLTQQFSSGYLVDKDGFVEIPVLGRMKVGGYTTSQARDIILKQAGNYFKDPTVIVRYANFKFSVTGEVLKPGVYVSPNEKVSVLDALSLAGDLTVFGKRDNVLLIRENADGTKTPYRINLKKSDFMSSPFFYLRQNDLIYVEPSKGKAAATDAAQAKIYVIVGAVLSLLVVIFSRVK